MALKRSDFTIRIAFNDGFVSLGMDDELIVEPEEGNSSVLLNDDRLALIQAVQQAEIDNTEGE